MPTAGNEAAVGQATATVPLGPVDSLLALQEVPDATHARRQAVRRAGSLLDYLEEIRLGLLLGRIPVDRLQALAEELKRRQERVSDPRLAEVIAEVELRAAVELAKLGR